MNSLIAEAAALKAHTSKLGRNDKCWCGSGKKHKRCHLGRENQTPVDKQDFHRQRKRIYEKGMCLHPDAGPSECSDGIIKAHTIQRNGGLSRISRNGQVYTFVKHMGLFDDSVWDPQSGARSVGIKKASTFSGFCSRHDNDLFTPLERSPFHGSPVQVALLGYRATCHQLHMKERTLAAYELRRHMDKGIPPVYQYKYQRDCREFHFGVGSTVKELRELKRRYTQVILEERTNDLASYVVRFASRPQILSSDISQATHDFHGNKVHDLGDPRRQSEWLTFSLIATDEGSAAVFTWLKDHTKSRDVVRSFHAVSDADLPHAIIRWMLEFCENTYFAPDWWDGLERPVQIALKERQLRGITNYEDRSNFPRPDDCLLDDGIRAVDWPVISRDKRNVDKPN